MSKHLKLCLLIVGLFTLDLLSKHLFFDLHMYQGGIIYPIFNLGVSWSMQVPLLVTVLIGWISLLLFLIVYNQRYISWVVAAFLIAGTLGNLADRIFLGGVRDFIYIGHWFPIFNIADICLNAGIILYFIKEFSPGKGLAKK